MVRVSVLAQRTDEYFARLESEDRRGGPSDYLCYVGLLLADARRICQENKPGAAVLRRAAGRIRAHLETAAAWSGTNASKAQLLLRLRLWDGDSYAEDRSKAPAEPVTVLWASKAAAESFA